MCATTADDKLHVLFQFQQKKGNNQLDLWENSMTLVGNERNILKLVYIEYVHQIEFNSEFSHPPKVKTQSQPLIYAT